MTICKQCGNYFTSKSKKYAGDAHVCSDKCAKQRIKDILNIDNNLNNPHMWDNLLLNKIHKFYICEYCHSKIMNLYIPCFNLDNSIYYCSNKCQNAHWLNGYSTIYWRNGKDPPPNLKKTPSFYTSLNEA